MENISSQMTISEICRYLANSISSAYLEQDKNAKIAITVEYNEKDNVHVEGEIKARNAFVHIPFEVMTAMRAIGFKPSDTLKVTSSINYR